MSEADVKNQESENELACFICSMFHSGHHDFNSNKETTISFCLNVLNTVCDKSYSLIILFLCQKFCLKFLKFAHWQVSCKFLCKGRNFKKQKTEAGKMYFIIYYYALQTLLINSTNILFEISTILTLFFEVSVLS